MVTTVITGIITIIITTCHINQGKRGCFNEVTSFTLSLFFNLLIKKLRNPGINFYIYASSLG